MNPLYVGIDVSEDHNETFLMNSDGSKLSSFSVLNDRNGAKLLIERIISAMKSRSLSEVVIGLESTSVYGDRYKVMIDEDAGRFMVAQTRNYREENPDVIDFKDVTGVDIDIDEDRDEEMREDSEGNEVSYNPPRYNYSYDFNIVIRVRNPYFDEIRIQLNNSSVYINYSDYSSGGDFNISIGGVSLGTNNSGKPDPHQSVDYCEYEKMCKDIKAALTSGRKQAREQAAAANAPRIPVVCKCCGATTMPDMNGCCEFCGGKAQ